MSNATLEYDPPQAAGVLILLHGLGASGADLFPLAQQLCGSRLRVICPHAKKRVVTINGGWRIPAWYDILGENFEDRQDESGIQGSAAIIEELLAAELARGFSSQQIFLGGFSQGAAISIYAGLRHQQPLAGIIALSGYMLLGDKLLAESATANRQTPIFQAHGTDDSVVLPEWANLCRDRLQSGGWSLSYHEYPMAHTIVEQEIQDLNDFLQHTLAAKAT